jgi:hypothetical protein
MKAEQRNIKFTYHFSQGNETMKSLLENSVCQECTLSYEGKYSQENICPDMNNHHKEALTKHSSSPFSSGFVSSGLDILVP